MATEPDSNSALHCSDEQARPFVAGTDGCAIGENAADHDNAAEHEKGQRAARLRATAFRGLVALGLGLVACQGPGGGADSYYGAGTACSIESYEALGPVSLTTSLDPLRDSFDRDVERPRIIALMPHMGCERGAEILRSEVLDAFPGADLRLYVIWQDVGRRNDREAARRASGFLDDARVTCFHDGSGLAGRAFARGKLPITEAREVFLFYPAGIAWPRPGSDERARLASADAGSASDGAPVPQPGATPSTETWVHRLGRVAPEKFCAPHELPAGHAHPRRAPDPGRGDPPPPPGRLSRDGAAGAVIEALRRARRGTAGRDGRSPRESRADRS